MALKEAFENYILTNYRCYYYNDKKTDYYISDKGDVYSFKTHDHLKPAINTSGRYEVCMFIDGKSITEKVHRMVYSTYVGKIPDGHTINHIDENFHNNYYKNLEVMTHSENTLEYLKNHPDAFDKKYSDKLVHELCSKLKSGIYYRVLSKEYDIPISFMEGLVNLKVRKNISYQYAPFPLSARRAKLNRSDDIKSIEKLVLDGKSNEEIRNILNLENENATSKLINRCRRKFNIPDPRYFDKEFIRKIESLIKFGMSNSQIINTLNLEYSERLGFLFTRCRKKLNIPDYNENGVSLSIQNEICKMIMSGSTNKEIMLKYNLTKSKYTTNMLGRLRQKVKLQSSTTRERLSE